MRDLFRAEFLEVQDLKLATKGEQSRYDVKLLNVFLLEESFDLKYEDERWLPNGEAFRLKNKIEIIVSCRSTFPFGFKATQIIYSHY